MCKIHIAALFCSVRAHYVRENTSSPPKWSMLSSPCAFTSSMFFPKASKNSTTEVLGHSVPGRSFMPIRLSSIMSRLSIPSRAISRKRSHPKSEEVLNIRTVKHHNFYLICNHIVTKKNIIIRNNHRYNIISSLRKCFWRIFKKIIIFCYSIFIPVFLTRIDCFII